MYVRVRLTTSKASSSKTFCRIIFNVDQELEEVEMRFLKEVKTSGSAILFYMRNDVHHSIVLHALSWKTLEAERKN